MKKIYRQFTLYFVLVIIVMGTLLILGQMNVLDAGKGWDSTQVIVAQNFVYVIIFILAIISLVGMQMQKNSDLKMAGGFFCFILMGVTLAGLARNMFDNAVILDEWVVAYPGSISEIMGLIILASMFIGGIYVARVKR